MQSIPPRTGGLVSSLPAVPKLSLKTHQGWSRIPAPSSTIGSKLQRLSPLGCRLYMKFMQLSHKPRVFSPSGPTLEIFS